MRARLALALALALPPAAARAEEPPAALREPVIATRRHGFAIGGSIGLRLGAASGTPLAYSQRTPDYEVSRAIVAPGGSVFVGDAISDAIVLGPVVELGGASRDDVRIRATGVGLRFEAFPLVPLGGAWRDLGLGLDVGTGTASFTRIGTGEGVASSGAYSMIALSAFWESLRAGGFHLGPAMGIDHRSSATFSWTCAFVGVRGGWYAGP